MNNNPKGNPATLKSFKAKWSTPETKTIRVPEYLADRVLRYARDIDSYKDKRDRYILTSDDIREMLDVVDKLQVVLTFPRQSFTNPRKQYLSEQIYRLLSLIPAGQKRPAPSERRS